ncbi:hypothetical protein WDZ92_46965, partial [Nostoc sp. NIES-2111]
MNIDDLKLRTKLLIPLVTMAFVAMSMVAFGIVQLTSISRTASDIIERKDMAATFMERANQSMLEVPYSVLGILAFDPNSVEGKAANAAYPKAMADGAKFVDEAASRLPEKKGELTRFKERFLEISESTKPIMVLANDLPPLTAGSSIPPDILEKFGRVATMMIDVDLKSRALRGDIVE